MVKLDLGVAKLDWYVLSNPSANTGPFSFSIDHEGIFLFIKPVQLALLWPCVQHSARYENRAGVLPGQKKTGSAPDGHIAVEALQLAEALAPAIG